MGALQWVAFLCPGIDIENRACDGQFDNQAICVCESKNLSIP